MSKPFYKFISDDSPDLSVLKSICEGNIMFSRIPDLNDISETFVLTDSDEIKETLSAIRKNGLDGNVTNALTRQASFLRNFSPDLISAVLVETAKEICSTPGIRPEDFVKRSIDKLPDMMEKVNKVVQDEMGIFCVSERVNCFPMWAHYADNAQGYAVEYANLDEVFDGDESGELNQLKKVEYYPKERLPLLLNPSDLSKMLYSKHEDWSYEHEYRVIRHLPVRPKQNKTADRERYFFKVDPQKCISRIIVGWKCREKRFEEIKKVASQFSVRVVRAKVEKAEVVV